MRSWAGFLVLGAAFALGGCGDDNTTIVQGGVTLTGNFPGTQIIDYLVSDDGRAFNHSGAKITKGIQVFWNGSNGNAIVLYLDGWERLWAHYWNGTTFTPGVELRGPNQHDLTHNQEDDSDDDYESFEIYRVLFLNTSTGGRNGDALILWTRPDDPVAGSATDNQENTRLFGTYFDVSVSGSATSAGDSTVHYGFESEGTTIDFNNSHGDVDDFGFVSDSLKFTHGYQERDEDSLEWPNRYDEGSEDAIVPATRSGDPTSYVWFVWRKDQRDFTGVGISNRYHALQFNLAQVGNAIPVQTALGQGTIAPAAGTTIADTTAVDHGIVVHNGCMIWRTAVSTGATGIFMTCFDATGNLGTIELSQSALDSIATGTTVWAGTVPEMPLPGNVYGDDDGLTSLYAFFRTTEFPGHIAATKTDLDATFDQAAREISPIEGPGGSIVPFSGGKDQFAPETRINRASQWIFVTWLQDTAVETELAGLSSGVLIHMHGVQTRTSATARTLPNSIVTGGPFLAPNQVTATNNPDQRLFLQSELANGMEDPRCGIQSNLDRINLAWHEGIDPLVELKHNGLTIALSGVATTPPTGGPSVAAGGLVARGNTGYNAFDSSNGLQPVVTDLGTAAGDPLIYFVNNQNNPTDPAAPGAFNEFRVFGLACIPASAPADAQLISTDGPNADNTMNDIMTDDENEIDDYVEDGGHFLHVKTTPTSTTAGAHGGTRVHLFFMEASHGENSKPTFRTRYFTKSAFSPASAAATFTTAHTPSLAVDPTALGGPGNDENYIAPTVHPDDDEKGPFTAFCTATGNTVGVYFTTTAHFWYQEFNGSSWLGAPEIIDNESSASIFYGRDQRAYAFPPMRSGTCDNLGGTLVFYSKNPPGEDPGHRRQWVRVHD